MFLAPEKHFTCWRVVNKLLSRSRAHEKPQIIVGVPLIRSPAWHHYSQRGFGNNETVAIVTWRVADEYIEWWWSVYCDTSVRSVVRSIYVGAALRLMAKPRSGATFCHNLGVDYKGDPMDINKIFYTTETKTETFVSRPRQRLHKFSKTKTKTKSFWSRRRARPLTSRPRPRPSHSVR